MVAKYCPMALPFGYGVCLRRQRPQAGAVDRRVLAEVHAERPHAGHDGDEVLPCRWWAEGALTTFPACW
ncbi:MAG: hypothetical protein ACLSVD_04295 [Eggerthellaceae bacterium]